MKRKLICLIVFSLLLSGCKFVRPTDADKFNVNNDGTGTVIDKNVPVDDGKISLSELLKPDTEGTQTDILPITENPVSIVIENGNAVDLNSLITFFYEDSVDDLMESGCLQIKWAEDDRIADFICDKDNIELIYGENKNKKTLFWVWDNNGDAGRRYEEAIPFYFDGNEISQRIIDMYPEEDLESCSREEAIAFCAPLAKACGYENAQVNVYAMTKEVLNDFPEMAEAFDMGPELEPPYSNMESTVTLADIRKAQEAGDEELVKELEAKRQEESQRENFGEWTDETEAYLLVYRSVLNGRLFDTSVFDMTCIFVPAYNKVVYVEGQRCVSVVETLEEVELISEEDALAEALRVIKVDSVENITLKRISMVYSPRYDQAGAELKRRVVDPCWRIDYQLSEEMRNNATVAYHNDGTVLINAVDGRENKYSRG